MRALISGASALLSFIFLLLGYLGLVASIIGILQNYESLSLSGAPLLVYEYYSGIRDKIFWAIQLVLIDWWIDIDIPIIVKDTITSYLFFGLAYNRSPFFMPSIMQLISRDKIAFGEADTSALKRVLRSVRQIATWPYQVVLRIRSIGNWHGQDLPPHLPDATKALILRARRTHDIAFLISFPVTVIVSTLGVFVFYYWMYLESGA